MAIYAVDEAVANYRDALAAIGFPPSDDGSARILARLSRALFSISDTIEAQSYLLRAFEYYERTADVARAVDVVDFSMMPSLISRWSASAGFINSLTKRALKIVSPESLEAGKMLCQYGRFLTIEAGYDAASDVFRQAVDIAKRKGDLQLEARIWSFWADAAKSNLRVEQFVENSSRATEMSRTARDINSERYMLHQRGFHFLATGDPATAKMHVNEMLKFHEQNPADQLPYGSYHIEQCIEQFSGNWEKARDYIDRVLYRRPGDRFSTQNLAILEYELGNLKESESCLEGIASRVKNRDPHGSYVGSAMECMSLARLLIITDDDGRKSLVKSTSESILRSPFVEPFTAAHATAALGLLALGCGDTEIAARLDVVQLEGMKGTLTPWGNVLFDRLLGRLNQFLGKNEAAELHYRDAIDFCRKAGYLPELAWTFYDFASLFLSGSDAEHRQIAGSRLNKALAIADELSMRSLSEQINKRLMETEDKSPGIGHSLSKREIEVLRLLARGKTNREIAYDLFISEYTVGNHVSRILAKTKTTNRTKAALFASHRGLIGD